MILIQIVAAALLILGSGLLIHALVALDVPSRPRVVARQRFDRATGDASSDESLPRAA